jgi:hypothetical protein
MNAWVRRIGGFAAAIAMATAGTSFAHEGDPSGTAWPRQVEPPATAPYPGSGNAAQATVDPLVLDPIVRALVIGIAANILREAAAQPDPVDALGHAVERRISAALADPNTMRLAERALQHAFQDAPVELREPLALFATSVLHGMRREMLEDMRPRGRY